MSRLLVVAFPIFILFIISIDIKIKTGVCVDQKRYSVCPSAHHRRLGPQPAARVLPPDAGDRLGLEGNQPVF